MSRPPRKALSVPTAPASALAESTHDDLRDLIRHEQPTATRDLSVLKPHPDPSRPLEPQHVVEMARSIGALGLIHPLVIDTRDTIIAGSHRFAALQLLAAPDRAATLARVCGRPLAPWPAPITEALDALPPYNGLANVDTAAIPVRIMPLSIAEDPQAAWRVEVAENERRRDYSRPEIQRIAETLKRHGFRFDSGRPKAGEQPALPILATLVGKSARTLRRLLNEPDLLPAPDPSDTDAATAASPAEGAAGEATDAPDLVAFARDQRRAASALSALLTRHADQLDPKARRRVALALSALTAPRKRSQ